MSPADDGPSETSLVTLGHVDVDPEVLTGEGGTLIDAIGAGRSFDDHRGWTKEQLPRTGWRLVHRITPTLRDGSGSDTFAAPHPLVPGAWAMASLSTSARGRTRS